MANGVIQTYTGKKINVPYMTKEDFDIIDVAHSLSLTCRYSGHCLRFYSVAEHCLIVSHLLEKQFGLKDALWGLLHDSGESYFGDVASPIKVLLPDYQKLEDNFLFALSNWFYLPWYIPKIVRDIDKQVLKIEQKAVMKKTDWIWDETKEVKDLPYTLEELERQIFGFDFSYVVRPELVIEEKFINKFNYLIKEIEENEKEEKSKSR